MFEENICVSKPEVKKSCGSEWIEKIQVVENAAEELAFENQRLIERCIEIGFRVRVECEIVNESSEELIERRIECYS